MKKTERSRVLKNAAPILLGLFMALSACAAGAILKWNQVDNAALMRGPTGNEKFNAIRVATFGPHAEQVFGYFLYRDGMEVITGGGASIERLGKMTPGEINADYARVVSRNMYNPRALVTREILRNGAVVGYTLTDIKIDVDLWDVTPAGQGATIVLRLDYKDRRNLDSGGDSQGILDTSR